MNYPAFLKKVDELILMSDAEALRKLVHEIARTVPENDRWDFLTKVNAYCRDSKKIVLAAEDNSDLYDKVDSVIESLEEIKSGELEIGREINERWDDWYDTGESEYIFSDYEEIMADITSAAGLLHTCLDRQAYVKGAELAKKMSEVKVHFYGEYGDGVMDYNDLICNDLIYIDLNRIVREAVYLSCVGNDEQDRAEAMITVIENFKRYNVSLEEVLQTGQDEIDLNALLPSWIEALAKRPDSKTDKLLLEAQKMLQDKSAVVENASRYAESHPALYQDIMSSELYNDSPEEMLRIGLRGIKEVTANNAARSSIALFTARYALKLQNVRTAEECWLEAFKSDPTVVNYLRLRLQAQKWEDYSGTVQDAYTTFYKSNNVWEKKPLAALMFFDGRFDEMISKFMKAGNGIGWSSTFMKEGIALMLLLLDLGENNRQGMTRMTDMAITACSFSSESYYTGMRDVPEPDTKALFQDCFRTWKKQIDLPENTRKKWMVKTGKWLSLRVEAIMNANRRNYYGECAGFIAAYGEVLESMGELGAKEAIMQKYRSEYSRRRAFHEELRNFGMRK